MLVVAVIHGKRNVRDTYFVHNKGSKPFGAIFDSLAQQGSITMHNLKALRCINTKIFYVFLKNTKT